MSSELEATAELNSTFPDGIAGTGSVVVRAEEALIVILVLVLWVAAIALFFNRWGKIRMLEPYQPKFQQQHRQSCAMVDPNPLQHRSYSKFNIHCLEHPILHQGTCGVAGGPITRLRQNSVFVGSSASLLPGYETPRRAKSAFDLQSLVHAEGARSTRGYQDVTATVPEVDEERDGDTLRTLRSISEASRLLQRERRASTTYQFDRMDVLAHPMPLRERGMSICHFDRTDVLARPLQRDRGMSICHFDRTDVLARPLMRDRGMSICHFDRMDVLARPTPPVPSKSLLRERRVSVCNFLERSEESAYGGGGMKGGLLQRQDRRLSVNNVSDRIDAPGRSLSLSRDYRGSVINMMTTPDIRQLDAGVRDGSRNNTAHLDHPSCSKTPDVVLGYKATCV
ncbi:hypothetical protein DMN91_009629 [Ooceraea biroi]|uniref:Fibronectin type III domain-containing protein n=1 Tax=Ooceraea biroi TaxID=2015173 RepID=A0A3L8DAN1_OOCBI|nr:uncharacterized protein LOC105283732 isoform X1 [Ooceraea biroi]RLU17394.1 hypothetical protein DMN91_009629 [Ooceraea biroi]